MGTLHSKRKEEIEALNDQAVVRKMVTEKSPVRAKYKILPEGSPVDLVTLNDKRIQQ